MIELNEITKKYNENTILKKISLKIPKNTVTGIIGPNGAGKSTLIKILTGFEFAQSGLIYIEDKKIDNFNQIKEKVSYMPEKMAMYPDYFVKEFLDFFHNITQYKDEQLLKALNLANIFSKKIRQLSKGWLQRLKLYFALCNQKPIVILDEPFEGFDPLQMKEIIKILISQKKTGRTFILSIHQLSYAEKICDNFLFLNHGKIIASGTFEDLSQKFNLKNGNLEQIFLKVLENE